MRQPFRALQSPTSSAPYASNQSYRAPPVQVRGGRQYVLRCWVYRHFGEGPESGRIAIEWRGGGGNIIRADFSAVQTSRTQELVITATAPNAAVTAHPILRVVAGGPSTAFGHPELKERADGVSIGDGVIDTPNFRSDRAVIGSAQIADLSVGTLKITDGAVTDSVGALTAAQITPAWADQIPNIAEWVTHAIGDHLHHIGGRGVDPGQHGAHRWHMEERHAAAAAIKSRALQAAISIGACASCAARQTLRLWRTETPGTVQSFYMTDNPPPGSTTYAFQVQPPHRADQL